MWIALITPVLVSMGASALLLAALIIFSETGLLAGFFLPGDSLLFTVGVLTASGILSLPIMLVLPVLIAAAILGDTVGYLIGQRLGARLFSRPRSRVFNPAHVTRAQRFIAEHGHGAVVMARFLPWARTFVPVVAGAGSMPSRAFLRVNATGATAWVVGVTSAGYLLGHVPWVADHVRLVTFLIGIATLLPVLAVRAGRRAHRTRRARVPLLPIPVPARA